MGEAIVDFLQALGVQRCQRPPGGGVQRAPTTLEQRLVSDVLGERVLEHEAWLPAGVLVEELEILKLNQLLAETGGLRPDRLEQAPRNLATDHRRGLQHPPRRFRKPIHAGHQDVLYRVGHQRVGASFAVLERRTRELLQEEWVALAALQDHPRERVWNR